MGTGPIGLSAEHMIYVDVYTNHLFWEVLHLYNRRNIYSVRR